MKFTNLTRAEEIGANCYLVESGKSRVLLDAGMHPREVGALSTPDFSLLGGRGFDAMVLTHAHQDHVGCLPLAMRQAPDAPVFMTEATAGLSEVMLHNSVSVMMRQREELGSPDLPLFSHREIDNAMDGWEVVRLSAQFDLGDEVTPELLVERGLVRRGSPVKILGDGDLAAALRVKAHRFSRTARQKIEAAGGTCEELD